VTTLGRDFETLQGQFERYRGGEFDTSGYGVRIGNLEREVVGFGEVGQRISTLEGQLDQVGDVKKYGERIAVLEGQVGVLDKGIQGREGVKGLSVGMARGFAEFAESSVAAVRAMEKSGTLTQRYATDVERAHAQLEVDIASADPDVIGASTMKLMKSMRTMVKAASKGTPEGATLGSQLDAQIRDIEARYG
jgi:hypothetical protein